MIVKVMITIKFYGRSTRDTFNKTYVTIILSRLLPVILISTLFVKTRRTIYLAFDTIARVVAFKNSLTCVLCFRGTILFITYILQCERFFWIYLIDLRIAVPTMFCFLEFWVFFAIKTEMIRRAFATSTLFCFACTILANKSIVNIMFFLLPKILRVNYTLIKVFHFDLLYFLPFYPSKIQIFLYIFSKL